ncbi:alpha/beta hydrolase [Actinomycetaceae bacterium WB03_NA08]|uniref:Alpha/beta hydrolase n=1 Tax=Scrofimicrobium canadense TaxID=2652290 RepID=A0A6N7W868_9ACTO|nr:alpha/beta hydrolase [Scrofimicrobium canadense]
MPGGIVLSQNDTCQKPRRDTTIAGIPATTWGSPSPSVIVAIHGYFSSRVDPVVQVLAESAPCQVVSFDLPGHGSRHPVSGPQSWPEDALRDVNTILDWAHEFWSDVSIFAVSIGAYLSLLASADRPLRHAWFLAPLTDLQTMIRSSLEAAGVSEKQLEREGVVIAPSGERLTWAYFSFATRHVPSHWPHPTDILHAASDQTVPIEQSIAFADHFGAHLTVLPDVEHWFHTPEQLRQLDTWLRDTNDSAISTHSPNGNIGRLHGSLNT